MFKLVKQLKNIQWPVEVSEPINGGKTEKHEFTGVFNILPQSEYEKRLKTAKNDAELIKGFLVGWEGLADENGELLPFSAEVIDELAQYPYIRNGILRAYGEAAAGAPVKN